MSRLRRQSALLLVVCGIALASSSVLAQWLKYPTAGVPRTGDGKFNPSAPAPRMPDGKPDFSGIWLTDNPNCGLRATRTLVCGSNCPCRAKASTWASSLPGGLPYQPWLAALVKERTANDAKDDPHVRCLPGHVPARVRAAAPVEVRPDAGPARDAQRDERGLPSGVHSTGGRFRRIRCLHGRDTPLRHGPATRSW